MKEKLNNLLEKLKSIGYEEYILSPDSNNITIKIESTNRLTINDKIFLLTEYDITIKETSKGITIIY